MRKTVARVFGGPMARATALRRYSAFEGTKKIWLDSAPTTSRATVAKRGGIGEGDGEGDDDADKPGDVDGVSLAPGDDGEDDAETG